MTLEYLVNAASRSTWLHREGSIQHVHGLPASTDDELWQGIVSRLARAKLTELNPGFACTKGSAIQLSAAQNDLRRDNKVTGCCYVTGP